MRFVIKSQHIKEFIIYFTSLIFAFFICIFIVSATFYIHEGGHIAVGYVNNIQLGNMPSFNITNWVENPLLPIIKLPQRTAITSGYGTLGFMFGGVLIEILVFTIIIHTLYKFSKNPDKKYLWYILVLIILFELFGNVICGTDNHIGGPLIDCSGIVGQFSGILFILLLFPLTMLLRSYVKSSIIWMKNRIEEIK